LQKLEITQITLVASYPDGSVDKIKSEDILYKTRLELNQLYDDYNSIQAPELVNLNQIYKQTYNTLDIVVPKPVPPIAQPNRIPSSFEKFKKIRENYEKLRSEEKSILGALPEIRGLDNANANIILNQEASLKRKEQEVIQARNLYNNFPNKRKLDALYEKSIRSKYQVGGAGDFYTFVPNQYRPPYKKSVIDMYNNQLIELTKLLKNELEIIKTILKSKKGLDKIYRDTYIKIKRILLLQNRIKNCIEAEDSEFKIDIFNDSELIQHINDINAYYFFYYYFKSKNDKLKIPEFLYYKLNSGEIQKNEAYLLFKDGENEEIDEDVVEIDEDGNITNMDTHKKEVSILYKGAKIKAELDKEYGDFINFYLPYTRIGEKYIQEKKTKLPPSISDKFNEFIQLNKLKIIVDLNITSINDSTKGYIIAKNIDTSLNNYLKLILDKVINYEFDKINKPSLKLNDITNLSIPFPDNEKDLNIQKYIDEINDNLESNMLVEFYKKEKTDCKFIIYSEIYSTSSLYRERECLSINCDIIESLFKNNINPYIYDFNNNSIIHPLLEYHYKEPLCKLIENKIDLQFYTRSLAFINKEFERCQKTLGEKSKDNIYNFTNFCYDEVKSLIETEKFQVNIFKYIKQSFAMIFYIMNEYLFNKLQCFDESDKQKHIFNAFRGSNFLNERIDSYRILEDEDKQIFNDYIKHYETNKYIVKPNIKIDCYEKDYTDKYNNYNYSQKKERINSTYKILAFYNKILDKKYYNYFKAWEMLLDNDVSKSPDLILFELDKIENLSELSNFCETYFDNIKFIDNSYNEILKFIHDLLVHITKTTICFSIEMVTRRLLLIHYKQNYPNMTVDDIIECLSVTLTEFKKDLYDSNIAEKLVSNSINLFKDIEEKTNFEEESIRDILGSLFNKIQFIDNTINANSYIMNILNTDVINYFDTFIKKTISNWFALCENILKYVINYNRIYETKKICKYPELCKPTTPLAPAPPVLPPAPPVLPPAPPVLPPAPVKVPPVLPPVAPPAPIIPRTDEDKVWKV
jgi:hypothetical protein